MDVAYMTAERELADHSQGALANSSNKAFLNLGELAALRDQVFAAYDNSVVAFIGSGLSAEELQTKLAQETRNYNSIEANFKRELRIFNRTFSLDGSSPGPQRIAEYNNLVSESNVAVSKYLALTHCLKVKLALKSEHN
jgi:hypothetical protein